MVEINMPFPKCCDDCPMLDIDGDYPECCATKNHDSVGYNFPYRDKRMPFCPLVESNDAVYLVVNQEGKPVNAFKNKRNAEYFSRNSDLSVDIALLNDRCINIVPEEVEYYSVELTEKGEPVSLLHLTETREFDEPEMQTTITHHPDKHCFICKILDTDRDHAIERAQEMRRYWLKTTYGLRSL